MNRSVTITLGEFSVVLLLLGALSGVWLVRLASVVISDPDEGTYLYAGKLVADGLIPYRDFLLAHPPLAIYVLAGWFRWAGSDFMLVRIANIVMVLASTIPLYMIVRSLTSSRRAGLLSIVSYCTGILLIADMGRTVKLEPLMDAFLIGAFAIYVLRPNSVWLRALFGALIAGAILVKLVAVVPLAFIVLGDLVWSRPQRRFVRSWVVAALGAMVVLAPAILLLVNQPGFLDDVIWSQTQRAGSPIDERLMYLTQDMVRFPVIPAALVASIWLIVRDRESNLRVSSLVGVGGLTALTFGFKSFFPAYVAVVMPWLSIVFAVTFCRIIRRYTVHWRSIVVGLVVVVGLIVPLAYDEAYYRTGAKHGSSPAQIVALLQNGQGYIYSMYPAFALWSSRPEYPWYYAADSILPRATGRFTSNDFIEAFSGSTAVVLWEGELQGYSPAQVFLEREFRIAYRDAYFSLWVRV